MAKYCKKTCKKCTSGKFSRFNLIKNIVEINYECYFLVLIFAANCKWGNWTKWTSCSKSCGGGSQQRTRKVAKYAQPGGKKCSGSKRASRSCNTKKCPRGIVLGSI